MNNIADHLDVALGKLEAFQLSAGQRTAMTTMVTYSQEEDLAELYRLIDKKPVLLVRLLDIISQKQSAIDSNDSERLSELTIQEDALILEIQLQQGL